MISTSHEHVSRSWRSRAYHRGWLSDQARSLFDFFQRDSINPRGGFYDIDDEGRAIPGSLRQVHATARMVHCFSIGSLLGHPGSDAIVDHGMQFLWSGHRDPQHGGYMWSLDEGGPADDSKQAYGHAFVLLAASSAKAVGHPLGGSAAGRRHRGPRPALLGRGPRRRCRGVRAGLGDNQPVPRAELEHAPD
jgi:mannose/cellobiose epimerase-like protein (N-acyl-D-glucosamine 2-epimerase family)